MMRSKLNCSLLCLLLVAVLLDVVNAGFLYSGRLVLARDDRELSLLVKDPSVHVNASFWRPLLPQKDSVTRKRIGTCSVVGSSGSLLGRKLGAVIDSADVVVRFNLAPTGEFARDVGHKTTWRFVNDPQWLRLRSVVSETDRGRVFTPCVSRSGFWKFSPNANLTAPQRHTIFDECIHPRFVDHVFQQLQPTRPSRLHAEQKPTTGLMAVLFLINVCDNVAVFGFDHAHAAYHYWDPHALKRVGPHQWSHELALLKKLQALRLLILKTKDKP